MIHSTAFCSRRGEFSERVSHFHRQNQSRGRGGKTTPRPRTPLSVRGTQCLAPLPPSRPSLVLPLQSRNVRRTHRPSRPIVEPVLGLRVTGGRNLSDELDALKPAPDVAFPLGTLGVVLHRARDHRELSLPRRRSTLKRVRSALDISGGIIGVGGRGEGGVHKVARCGRAGELGK